ncbi:MAG TPA: hypothetical protein VE465_14490 [Streptosporangiaceae bacterium]|nr:hypothetical protein [Streptosporangiaceae bacterium]
MAESTQPGPAGAESAGAEYFALLHEAGLTGERVTELAMGLRLVEVVPPQTEVS